MLTGLTLGLALAASGCSVEIPIMQYPAFWGEREIDSVAVAPFGALSVDDARAGDILADSLTGALIANGTYEKVMGRLSLAEHLTEGELGRLAEGDPAIVRKLAELTDIDAVIVGTVLHALSDTGHYRTVYYNYPYYGYGGYGGYYYPYGGGYYYGGYGRRGYGGYGNYGGYGYGGYYGGGYSIYEYEVSRGSVAATGRMLATDTGQTLHASPPVERRVISQGSPPLLSEGDALARAIADVTMDLVEQFAIVPRVIEVKRSDALRISDGSLDDDEYRKENKFRTADTRVAVVVNLPPAAALNEFSLTIRRKDSEEVVAQRVFLWQRDAPSRGVVFEFDPAKLAAAGTGKFEVTFRTVTGQAITDEDFEITGAD